jgi:hypothetical protein
LKHQLIHIPKTGGTALYVFLQRVYPEHFEEFMYPGQPPHELKANFVPNPVVIVRDPFERILSLFRYWKSGSEMFSEGDRSAVPLSSFLQEVNIFNVWTGYTGPEHLLPQTYWVSPESHRKSIVIRYREDLDSSMRELVDYLGLAEPEESVPRMNVTLNREPIEVSDADMKVIRFRYATDFLLWERANKHPDRFKKVI